MGLAINNVIINDAMAGAVEIILVSNTELNVADVLPHTRWATEAEATLAGNKRQQKTK